MNTTTTATSKETAATCLSWIKKGDSADSMQRPTVSLSLKSLAVASV